MINPSDPIGKLEVNGYTIRPSVTFIVAHTEYRLSSWSSADGVAIVRTIPDVGSDKPRTLAFIRKPGGWRYGGLEQDRDFVGAVNEILDICRHFDQHGLPTPVGDLAERMRGA